MAYLPCIFATKIKSKSHFVRINPVVEITEEDVERAVEELRS